MGKMGFKESNSPRKPMKRKSHTRRIPQDCIFNMAEEARRDIVNGLHLHRSPTSSSSSTSCGTNGGSTVIANNCNYRIKKPTVASSQHYYSIMETLPLPEPIWSTTAPSILAAPPPLTEALEFEWGENLADSYTWWLGFLKTLDGKNTQESKCLFEDNVDLMGNSEVFGECMEGSILREPPSLDTNGHSPSPDDQWLLTIPTNGDQGEIVNPKECNF